MIPLNSLKRGLSIQRASFMGLITMEVRKSRGRGKRTGSTFMESLNETLAMENLDESNLDYIDSLCFVAILMKNGNQAFGQ